MIKLATKTTKRKTTTTTKTKTTNLLDELQLLIDDIVMDTFHRDNLNESLTSSEEKGIGYRPRLFRMIEAFSKKHGFRTVNDVDRTYQQLCELEHLDNQNPTSSKRMKWTNRWIKKADKESRQKVPQPVTQMFTDFRSVFKDKSLGGLCTVRYEQVTNSDGKSEKVAQPTTFEIFDTFDSYQDMLNALKESRENAKDEYEVELKDAIKWSMKFLIKNPQRLKTFLTGFLKLCNELDVPFSKQAVTPKKPKTVTARNKKSKEK